MRVPLSWLRDFAPFDLEPKELGLVFDDLGMVVEGIEFVGGNLDGVVVATLLDIQPIEGLDRVRMTTVDAGDGEPLEVACGAWNIEPGQLVPLATIGTTLPNGMTIGRRKLKNVYSNGMLCSAVELGLGADGEGILILDPASGARPGMGLQDALGIEPDVVYDLAIEGNRPDANCIAGVARDAAARLGLPFSLPALVPSDLGEPVEGRATISNSTPALCPRFTVTVITDVMVGPSPDWMQKRLALAGMRAINNIVDASNYVMLELGQPTHPYDLDKLPGRGLSVRNARPGETLVTLDGVERRLGVDAAGQPVDDCVICDADGSPVGIGGIMGGASSEISDATTTVLLEAANFERMAIAWTSKRLNLRTEASARFERGVDPEVIELAVSRFCDLIGTGTRSAGMLDDRSGMRDRPSVRVRTARVNALLGAELTDEQVRGYLAPLGFDVDSDGPGLLDVQPPSFRPDVALEVDVIEEVARHHGYANIRRTLPRSPQVGGLSGFQRDRRNVREILAGTGVSEAQTPSLLGPGDHERANITEPTISASNAMIQEESILRSSLMPGLLRALAFNAARREISVMLFEIGKVWHHPALDRVADGLDATLPDEVERLAVALAGSDAKAAKQVWDELGSGLRIANVALETNGGEAGLHPTRTATIVASGTPIGVVGEIDPGVTAAWGLDGRVGWLDIDLQCLLAAPRNPIEQRPVSKFPSADIDLAFVVPDDEPAGRIEAVLRMSAGELLADLRLFDVYRGDRVAAGSRGLTFRLRFNAQDRTLTDADVGKMREQLIAAVHAQTGARLRA